MSRDHPQHNSPDWCKKRLLQELSQSMTKLATLPPHDVTRFMVWIGLHYTRAADRTSVIADVLAELDTDEPK